MSHWVHIDIDKAIRLYRDQKLSTTKVSKIVGCSVQTLINRLREKGIDIRSCGWDKQKISFEIIRYEYEDLRMSTPQIAKKYNMNTVSIWDRLIRGGVKMRDRKEEARKANTKIPTSEHQAICDRYQTNEYESCADIAKDYGVHKSTIATILKQNSIIPKHDGTKNKQYKGGITPLHTRIRHCEKSREWRKSCMERDDYTCYSCRERGGRLNVHHCRAFSIIFEDFLLAHSDRTEDELFDLAQSHGPFWDIGNGITICEDCHDKIHAYEINENLAIPALFYWKQGLSRHQISKKLKCDWHTVDRILRLIS